jgi:SulP family sulfate permease
LYDAGVELHLSEVKGPVMDRLQDTAFLRHLSGSVYLSTFDAWHELHGTSPAALSTPCLPRSDESRIVRHFS